MSDQPEDDDFDDTPLLRVATIDEVQIDDDGVVLCVTAHGNAESPTDSGMAVILSYEAARGLASELASVMIRHLKRTMQGE